MLFKCPLPLAIGSIPGSNSNVQAFAKPNSISYALLLLPKMALMVSGGAAYTSAVLTVLAPALTMLWPPMFYMKPHLMTLP